MSKSDYRFQVDDEEKTIFIEDLNLGRCSVTNDIENVVEEIAEQYKIDPRKFYILYRDSQGVVDGWSALSGNFIACSAPTFEEGLKSIKSRSSKI